MASPSSSWLLRMLLFPVIIVCQLVLVDASLTTASSSHSLKVSSSMEESHLHRQQRMLSTDFDELNQLLEDVVIRFPDSTVSTSLITLNLRNTRCTNFRIDDFVVQAETAKSVDNSRNQQTTTVQINLEGLDMVCYLDYVYTFLFTRRGSADLYSYDNRASISMAVQQQSVAGVDNNSFFLTATEPPTVEQCNPQVNVADMNFHGDIAAVVLNTIEGLMRGKLEDMAEQRICEELRSLGTSYIADLLEQVDSTLAQYYNNAEGAAIFDPLELEKDVSNNDNDGDDVKLLNLQAESSVTAKWLDRMLAQAQAYATKDVEYNDNSFGEQQRRDMNVNVWIRDAILSAEERALVVDIKDDDLQQLFYRHDRFTETTLTLHSVKIFGLDMLTGFEPLVNIGKYTVQNKLSWKQLTVEVDAGIDIKPSTKDDSVFVLDGVTRNGVKERVKVTFGVDDISVVASVLLGIDEAKLGALQLGSLLDSEKILDCLLSTIHRIEVSGLSLEFGNIQSPTLEGFVSRGIDRVVSTSVKAAFLMYESTLREAAPSFFHTTARNFVNKNLF